MIIAFSIFISYNMYCKENKQLILGVPFLNIEALASGRT